MIAALIGFLVAFFLVEIYHAHKYAPRYPTGAFTHHAPVYEPKPGWWAEPGVFAFGAVIVVLYLFILAVSL